MSSLPISVGTRIGGINKLIPNLGNKGRYVLHYRNLQQYFTLGIKLIDVYNDFEAQTIKLVKKVH